MWDIQNPLASVHVSLTRTIDFGEENNAAHNGDVTWIRLRDPATNELFAEAPVTYPLHTCVERAIDSSRYFCVRVVDAESGKHAFIGLGFSGREQAGDFFGALVDHAQYLERQMRVGKGTEGGGEGERHSVAQPLSGSMPVTLRLNSNPHSTGFVSAGLAKTASKKDGGAGLSKTFSLMFAKNGGVEAALSSASNDSSPHGTASAGRRDTSRTSASASAGTDKDEVEQFDGGWGAFETAEE